MHGTPQTVLLLFEGFRLHLLQHLDGVELKAGLGRLHGGVVVGGDGSLRLHLDLVGQKGEVLCALHLHADLELLVDGEQKQGSTISLYSECIIVIPSYLASRPNVEPSPSAVLEEPSETWEPCNHTGWMAWWVRIHSQIELGIEQPPSRS